MSRPLPNSLDRQVESCHRELDAALPELLEAACAAGVKFYCRDRCSNCCSLAVFTTLPEALVIAASLTARQRTNLAEYLDRLKDNLSSVSDLKSFLKLHRKTIGFCPFLERDSCSIYTVRPLACRALLSTRPAQWCGVDFTDLHQLEQQAFLSSLDPRLVAYPSHYLAASQETAQHLEQKLLTLMLRHSGVAVSGHLPTLVWLAAELLLERDTELCVSMVREKLSQEGFSAPCLVQFQDGSKGEPDVY